MLIGLLYTIATSYIGQIAYIPVEKEAVPSLALQTVMKAAI